MKTLNYYYLEAKKRLREAGIDDPAFDAAALIEKHSGVKRYEIAICDKIPEKFSESAFLADLKRRESREPLQYILEVWPFYGFDFYVGKGVLIPRQDTEILAKTAIDFLSTQKDRSFIELCAGSGCLSTAVAKSVENSFGTCVELSADAKVFLNKNIKFHGLSNRLNIVGADVLKSETPKLIGGKYNLLICNPPYIKSEDIKSLQPEVAEFEPLMALDGGYNGLIFYRAIKNYICLIKDGGMIAFEVGIGEAKDVADLLKEFSLQNIFIKKDFNGIERVVGGFKRP